MINRVLKIRVDRPEEDFGRGVSYYLQNNRYHVFRKNIFSGTETKLIELENIYDFKRTGNLGNWVIFFDSDSSFYYAGGLNQISQRQVIDNFGNHRPFNVTYIGEGKVAIYFLYWAKEKISETETLIGDKEKTMIYYTEEDRLIPDLDKLLKK